MTTLDTRNPRLLMCRPEHFAVSYAINPWMDPTSWARDNRAHAAAAREWADLHRTLTECGADIDLVPSVPGLPDLVFTANAAVVLDRQVLLARFRHPERRREEVHFEAAFRSLQARGVVDSVCKLPEHVVLEGAGDCVWDETRKLFWMGTARVGCRRAATGRRRVRPGRDRARARGSAFYHMDTALSALPGGEVMYLPDAFTKAGRDTIRARVAPEQRIEIGSEDGCRLASQRRLPRQCRGDVGLRPSPARRAFRARLPGGDDAAALVPAQRRLGLLPDARLDRRSVPAAATPERAAVA
jgi:N-Dimethylarginine dimethylaminohydrolase